MCWPGCVAEKTIHFGRGCRTGRRGDGSEHERQRGRHDQEQRPQLASTRHRGSLARTLDQRASP